MREMILNHSSLPGFSYHQALEHLRDIAVGMADLVDRGVTILVFRTTKPLQDIECVVGQSLFDAFLALKAAGSVEEFRFFLSLTTKSPILHEVGEEVVNRFLACEETELPLDAGQPLLLCALTDWVAVGFPKPPWDRDLVTVKFDELLPNETIDVVAEKVDNLSRSRHAIVIWERHTSGLQERLELRTFWDRREAAFPRLTFGPDVETQIADLNPAHGRTIINRLAELQATAQGWQRFGGAMPPWTCKVTPESASVQNNTKLREARRFRSCSGSRELFIWHARFGSNGRIHLRFDPGTLGIEIGYIGRHLPL